MHLYRLSHNSLPKSSEQVNSIWATLDETADFRDINPKKSRKKTLFLSEDDVCVLAGSVFSQVFVWRPRLHLQDAPVLHREQVFSNL